MNLNWNILRLAVISSLIVTLLQLLNLGLLQTSFNSTEVFIICIRGMLYASVGTLFGVLIRRAT